MTKGDRKPPGFQAEQGHDQVGALDKISHARAGVATDGLVSQEGSVCRSEGRLLAAADPSGARTMQR